MPLHFTDANATFIHIPKNAGNSLEDWAIKHQLAYEDKNNHCTLEQTIGLWPDLGQVFSFVRNPFDRTVSMFHYLGQHAERKIRERKSADLADDIKTVTLYKRGFDYWLNCLQDSTSDFNEKPVIRNHNGVSEWPRRATQTSWLTGHPLAFVVKIENMQTEFKQVEQLLNCPTKFPIEKINPSQHNYYKEYYTPATIKIVRDMFKVDLDNFNYDF